MIVDAVPLKRPRCPFDHDFYHALIARRDSFSKVSEYTIPANGAYAFRVDGGFAWRLSVVERVNALDVCLMNADDPTEHFAPGLQLALEGGHITRLTRIWGTPPRSRPLATVLADTFPVGHTTTTLANHTSHAGHCNPHHWQLYSGIHPRTCYDNLRAGIAMLGLNQRFIHDNMNLLLRTALDPATGHYIFDKSEGEAGDHIEFYAEISQNVVISVCPYGEGIVEATDWTTSRIPTYPIHVGVYETGTSPLVWTY